MALFTPRIHGKVTHRLLASGHMFHLTKLLLAPLPTHSDLATGSMTVYKSSFTDGWLKMVPGAFWSTGYRAECPDCI